MCTFTAPWPGGRVPSVTVLLTNDDGIYSSGLRELRERLEAHHDVWTVAPDGERSGVASKITLIEPIRFDRIAERSYATSGTPVDCVILATRGAIPVVPDVVISGINLGPNLGTDITYSGTCAAAREAAYRRIPGIAVSLNSFHAPYHFGPVADFVVATLPALVELWDEFHFVNINAPNIAEPHGRAITEPAIRHYDDTLHPFEPPRGGTYFFVDGRPSPTPLREGTDWHAVEQGLISISPVALNPSNHPVEDAYRASEALGAR